MAISIRPLKVDFNGFKPGEGLPRRLKLFGWGTTTTTKGPVVLNDETVKVFDANQRKMGRDTCHIDFNHCTVEGTPEWKKQQEPAPIAGYFTTKLIPGDGLYAENVDTTVTGIAHGPNYKDLSPVPLCTEDGTLVGLHSLALVPNGAAEGLTVEDAALKALSAQFQTEEERSRSVPTAQRLADTVVIKPMNKYLQEYAKEKGVTLDPNATEEEAIAAITAHMGKGKQGPITPASSVGTEHFPAGFSYKAMAAEFETKMGELLKPLSAKIEAFTANEASNAAKSIKTQKETILADAAKEGRVITLSAGVIDGLTVDALREVVSNCPKNRLPTKPMAKVLSADGKTPENPKPTLAATVNATDDYLRQNFPGYFKEAATPRLLN